MKTATLAETENNLSSLVDQVRSGEPILIMDRGRPVARLESVLADQDPDGRLSRLERQGLLRRGEAPPPSALLSQKPPETRSGTSILEALLEERRSGR